MIEDSKFLLFLLVLLCRWLGNIRERIIMRVNVSGVML